MKTPQENQNHSQLSVATETKINDVKHTGLKEASENLPAPFADKNIQEKIKRNNHCPICKRPMTLLSVSDIFRRRKLREVKSKFILDFRDLQKEQEIKQETLAEVEKISKIVNFKSKKDRTFFENKLGEMKK